MSRKAKNEAFSLAERTESQYKAIFNALPDLFILKDAEDRWISASNSTLQVFQLNDIEYVNKTDAELSKLIKKDMVNSFLSLMDNDELVWAIGKTARTDDLILFVNGNKRVYDVVKVPFFDENGNKEMILTHCRDISLRAAEKKTAPVKELGNNTINQALEAGNIGFWEWDIAAGKYYFNPSLYKLLGYCNNEIALEPKVWQEILHPEDFAAVKEAFEQLSSGKISNVDIRFRIQQKNGNIIWVKSVGKTIGINSKGVPQKAAGSLIDISQLVKAEEEIDRLKQALEEAEKNLKVDIKKKYKDIEKANSYLITENEELKRMNLKVVNDTNKILVLNDELLESQKQLKQFIRELEERVEKRTMQLIKAKEKAEESDKLKTAFLSNMSHEIRTPMNAILGFTKMLDDPNLKDSERRDYIDIINQSSLRLLSVINDIIDISKIESNQIEMNEMNFSLNSLISELFKFYKPHVTRKKIKFKIHDTTGGTDYIVSGDEQKVYQVMSNLISNALKFTSTGTIEIGYKILKDAVRFHCKDTGIGISEDVQLKIFERFRQASFSHTKDHGGTGLGLSIAKGLVELMGGEIWFRSTVNKGSVFYFTIPYIPKANLIIPAGSSITGKTMEVEWSDKTFLVAEDEDLNYKYLYKILKKTKVNVIRVTTGREALDTALSNDRIDCILMDVKMPEMNGFEATKAIKAIKKNIPIIIVTAYALSGERELAFSSGCSDYLAKPYSDVDLINAIAKWM